MAKANQSYVGQYFEIPAGVTVYRSGEKTIQSRDTIVRVRRHDKTAKGIDRIWWKSNGYMASTVL